MIKELNSYKYYVFIDLDETLISEKSMFSFVRFFCENYCNGFFIWKRIKYYIFIYKLKLLAYLGLSRENINLLYYKFFNGVNGGLLRKACNQWFEQRLIKNKYFFNSIIMSLLQDHINNNGIPVIVSGSFEECVRPIANYCHIKDLIVINLEKDDLNKCTGKIIPPQTIGKGKAKAIKDFLQKNKFYHNEICYAYGDHLSDKPMLDIVGNPNAVIHSKNGDFEDIANRLGWKIIYTHSSKKYMIKQIH